MSEWGRWYVDIDKRDEAHRIADSLRELLDGDIQCICGCDRCRHWFDIRHGRLHEFVVYACNAQHDAHYVHGVRSRGTDLLTISTGPNGTVRWVATQGNELLL